MSEHSNDILGDGEEPSTLSAHPLKYSVIELERRFLLPTLPPGLSRPRLIHDRYIEGTRLRLRAVQDSEGVVHERKLGHKRRVDETDPSVVNHTSLHLNETEFETLSRLPGRSVVKTRWMVNASGRRAAVDVFEGRLHGLAMLEVNFDLHEDMTAYAPPPWAGDEVTHRDEFSGGALSALHHRPSH